MEIIDDQGRIFGAINIIDALAILLVLAVIIAGIAFINPFGEEKQQATRYATIDLGEQPQYISSLVSSGDQNIPEAGNLTITDTYRFSTDGNTTLFVRARLSGTLIELDEEGRVGFQFQQNTLQTGTTLNINTPDYNLQGDIVELDRQNPNLDTQQTKVLGETQVPISIARTMEVGDRYQINNQTIAEITSLDIYPTGNQNTRHVFLGINLNTLGISGNQQFGTTNIQIGNTIQFNTENYDLSLDITNTNTQIQKQDTSVVIKSTLPTNTANQLQQGDTHTINDRAVSTISSLLIYPTDNQKQKHALIQLDLDAIETPEGLQFGSTQLTIGNTISFSTDRYTIQGQIQKIDTESIYRSQERISATIKLENIPPEQADMISTGMTETIRGQTNAYIQNKNVEPATITLTSESGQIYRRQHPINKDVYLQTRLTVHPTETGIEFHGQPLQTGNTVTLDFGQTTITGQVTKINT